VLDVLRYNTLRAESHYVTCLRRSRHNCGEKTLKKEGKQNNKQEMQKKGEEDMCNVSKKNEED
jgi:hypothetical protein